MDIGNQSTTCHIEAARVCVRINTRISRETHADARGAEQRSLTFYEAILPLFIAEYIRRESTRRLLLMSYAVYGTSSRRSVLCRVQSNTRVVNENGREASDCGNRRF